MFHNMACLKGGSGDGGGGKKGIIYFIKLGITSFINTHKTELFIRISEFLQAKRNYFAT